MPTDSEDRGISADQLRSAMDQVLTEEPTQDLELTRLLRCMSEVAYHESDDVVFGIRVGFELVRRYGLLGAHPSAAQGPAAIIQEIAHRYDLHIAWVSRTHFELFLGDDEPVPLTDQQWAALDDGYDEFCDNADPNDYIRGVLERAGWRQDDGGIWHAPGSK